MGCWCLESWHFCYLAVVRVEAIVRLLLIRIGGLRAQVMGGPELFGGVYCVLNWGPPP
jgi:hypothetical protein